MSGLDTMKKRMVFDGGDTSDGRIVRGKYLSFKAALNNSYQAEWVTFGEQKYRCLINPDKQTEEYDQKEISIDFEAGMKCGDVFYWDRTDTHWIVYLQALEEEAYFRARIRQCNYKINDWWVYLRGPMETSLIWNQKHEIMLNEMNYTILMYVPKTEESLEYFSRFQILKFDGHNWRVTATDKYSQDGIIEVYLEEYFDNKMEDQMIIPEIIEPDTSQAYINGSSIVSAYDTNISYTIENCSSKGKFVINSKKVKIIKQTELSLVLDVITGRAGEFNLQYMADDKVVAELLVTIKSL